MAMVSNSRLINKFKVKLIRHPGVASIYVLMRIEEKKDAY